MKKLLAFTSVALASSALFATAPVVENVTMKQDAGRTVTISYTLSGEAGIVTVDVQTNGPNGWVSIGGKHLTHFSGDVNKKVEPGSRTMTWLPHKAWPDNEVKENVKAVVSAWALDAPPDYMVVSLSLKGNVRFYTSADAVPFGVTDDMYKTDYIVMRKIPAANVEWRRGSPTTENGRAGNIEDTYLVTLTKDYYIGIYELTQRQWEIIDGKGSSHFTDDYATRPVENTKLSKIRGDSDSWPGDKHVVPEGCYLYKLRDFTGVDFDLPTEAQWEFASRAGCGSALYNGRELENTTTSANLDPLACYGRTDQVGTAKVGSYEPNAWGIYDTLGNVWEWCLDYLAYPPFDDIDPEIGPTTGSWGRVRRGGSYGSNAKDCRSASRLSSSYSAAWYDMGFRLWAPAVVK